MIETIGIGILLVAKIVVDYSQSKKALDKVEELGKVLGGRLDNQERRLDEHEKILIKSATLSRPV